MQDPHNSILQLQQKELQDRIHRKGIDKETYRLSGTEKLAVAWQ